MIKVVITDNKVLKEKVNVDYEKKREAIRKEINSYPINVDRSVFTKTKDEKELVNKLKRRFK